MAAAARRDGLSLSITSGFRSDAEQARLFAANPDPKWVARPGTSLHRYGTELDLGPPAAYAWLAANATASASFSGTPGRRGTSATPATPASTSVGYGRPHRRMAAPRCRRSCRRASTPRSQEPRSAGTSAAALLAAQIYAESNFNPFARSPAGAQGIAQFMPGTARAYGLRDPYDAGPRSTLRRG